MPVEMFLRAVDFCIECPGGVHKTMGGPLLKAPEINKQSLNLFLPNTILNIGPFPPENPNIIHEMDKYKQYSYEK